MGRVSVTFKGLDKLNALAKANEGVGQIIDRALFAEATTVLNESKKIVPYRTRALQSSGKVEKPERVGDSHSIEISYGGPSASYAMYVHEIPKNYNHGRQWKYLETPFRAHEPKFVRNVKERIATYLMSKARRGR